MRALVLIFCLWMTSALGQERPINLRFDEVRISQFAKVVYGEILHRAYLVDDAVGHKTISLAIDNVTGGRIDAVLLGVLEGAGISVRIDAGVYVLTEKRDDALIVYRLRHRSVNYAAQFIRQAFSGAKVETFSRPALPAESSVMDAGGSAAAVKPPAAVATQAAAVQAGADEPEWIVFRVPARDERAARELLALIDMPAEQLYVRAVVYDVSSDANSGAALDLAVGLLGHRLGLSLAGGRLTGANIASIKTSTVDVVAGVLDADTRFRSVSRPAVRVRSGGRARFAVGQEVPTLGAVVTNQLGAATQSVVYRQAGTIFEVQPVLRDGGIDLAVRQTVSSFQVTNTSALNSPTLNKRELQTDLTVQAGEVVILAGLDADEETGGERRFLGVPIGRTGGKTGRQTLLLIEVQRLPG